jgi:hypothetical protein
MVVVVQRQKKKKNNNRAPRALHARLCASKHMWLDRTSPEEEEEEEEEENAATPIPFPPNTHTLHRAERRRANITHFHFAWTRACRTAAYRRTLLGD